MSGVKAETRVEDPAQAETEARFANLFGSWDAWQKAKPARRWVRTADGWSSFDPVIVRARERAEARKKREDEKAAKKAARLAKLAA